MCGDCCRFGIVRGLIENNENGSDTGKRWVCTWTDWEELLRVKATEMSFDWDASAKLHNGSMGHLFSDIAMQTGLAWDPLTAETNEVILEAVAVGDVTRPSSKLVGGVRMYYW